MIGIVKKILPWSEKGAGVPSPFVKVCLYFISGGWGGVQDPNLARSAYVDILLFQL